MNAAYQSSLDQKWFAEVSERLYFARCKKRLSVMDVSRITGLASQTIEKYEGGECNMRGEPIKLLCDALDMDPNWLLMSDDAPMKARTRLG